MSVSQPSQSSAQDHPDFRFIFDQLITDTNDVHTDTHRIIIGKPVKTLNLSMTSSGDPEQGEMHLPGTEILLDLSNAAVHDSVNSTSQLLVDVTFNDPLPIGDYPATKVVFGYMEGYFHMTTAVAYGTFFDGEPFYVTAYAGFVPEPTSCLLLIAGILPFAFQRLRRSS